MNRVHNVSATLNEDENKILVELMEELNRRSSIKGPNQAEILRHAIKFTRDNIDTPKKVEDLKKQLEAAVKKNQLFEQAFFEFKNKAEL